MSTTIITINNSQYSIDESIITKYVGPNIRQFTSRYFTPYRGKVLIRDMINGFNGSYISKDDDGWDFYYDFIMTYVRPHSGLLCNTDFARYIKKKMNGLVRQDGADYVSLIIFEMCKISAGTLEDFLNHMAPEFIRAFEVILTQNGVDIPQAFMNFYEIAPKDVIMFG